MTEFQRIVKYCAIALAVFLIVNIFSGIIGAITGVFLLFGSGSNVGENTTYITGSSCQQLKVDIAAANLLITEGTEYSVSGNIKDLTVTEENGTLVIKEKQKLLNKSSQDAVLKITVPKGYCFTRADISTGAGGVTIENLTADELKLQLGAGEVDIRHLTANRDAEIDGGAGKITVAGGALANLDMDMGVGEVNLTSRLTGDCSLDMGIGETNLTLIGSESDYGIDLDKGLGSITIDGKTFNRSQYGNGATEVDIDGGIGAINIAFAA